MKIEAIESVGDFLRMTLPEHTSPIEHSMIATDRIYLANNSIFLALPESIRFDVPGTYEVVVPEGVSTIKYEVRGAGGGGTGYAVSVRNNRLNEGSKGGDGARQFGQVSCEPADVLQVTEGAGGERRAPCSGSGWTGSCSVGKAMSGETSTIRLNGILVAEALGGEGSHGSGTSKASSPGANAFPPGGAKGGIAGVYSPRVEPTRGEDGSVSLSY